MSNSSPQSAPAALVTGASRGIGKVVALKLARRGYAVAVNYRESAADAASVVRDVERNGGRAVALQADVGDPAQARELVARTQDELGALDVLINNAGITRDRLLLQMSEEDWDDVWNVDLAGPRAAACAALQYMMERRWGRVVNLGSVVGATGNAGQANYTAAKSAILGLTRQLALQVGQYGVTVNCVIPGYIVTDATSHLTDQQQRVWMDRIPMGRPAAPEDVAEVVLFLTRPEAWYITGQCIAVDGGLLAKSGGGLAS